jgi:hypothetical protein
MPVKRSFIDASRAGMYENSIMLGRSLTNNLKPGFANAV